MVVLADTTRKSDDRAWRSRRPTTYHLTVEPTIVDVEAEQRYEARIEGDLAGFLDYVVKRGRIALIHTEVLEAFRGKGLAEQMARFALDDARRRGLQVIAICPYVRDYVERHPETRDIVVGMSDVTATTGE